MWIFYAVSSLLAAITCIALGIFVYNTNRQKTSNKRFAVVSIMIGLWSFFPFLTAIVENGSSALFLGRLAYIAAFVTPAAFFHFVFVTLDIHTRKRERYAIRISYLISILFCSVAFSPMFIKNVIPRMPNTHIVAGPLYPLYILFFSSLCPYAIYQIFLFFKKSTGFKREQSKFLFIGFLTALIAGSMHVLSPYFKTEIFPHDLLLIAWSAIISYAIVKHHYLDIRVAITRAGIFIFVYAFVLGVPFWIGYATDRWFVASILTAVLASIGPSVFIVLRRKAENIILAEQKRYQQVLLQASSGMVQQNDLNRLLNLMVFIIKRIVRIRFAAAFIENKEAGAYELRAMRNGRKDGRSCLFAYDHPLVLYMKDHRDPFTYYELPAAIKTSIAFEPYVYLIVPSYMEGKLLGFLFLGEKLNKSMYTEDDINIFKTLANQAALAISNCMYIAEFKKSQDRLFTAEKLALIGGMAAGASHQFRNRLNEFASIQMNLEMDVQDCREQNKGLIDRNETLKSCFDALQGYSASIAQNIRKTELIIKGIMNFSNMELNGSVYEEFSIRDAVDQAVSLAKIKHKLDELAKFPIEVVIANDCENIRADKVRITESIYNALDNSYEAVLEKAGVLSKSSGLNGFEPRITFKIGDNGGSYLIEIHDNGIGIKDDDKKRIFAPWFTTKPSSKSGSGIGIYFVKRCIEEILGGKVWFTSRHLEGTTFFFELPKKANPGKSA